MKKILGLMIVTIIILVTSITYAKDEYKDCTVTRIVDGDTFICDKIKIRIAWINAPELKKKGKKAEAYANEAKKYLSKLIKDKQVSIQIIGKDKYKRTLAYVDYYPTKSDSDYIDISQEMLMKGMAKSYTDFPNIEDSDKEILLNLEKEAKKNKVWLWSK